jgi:tetratricopeptide (TPR) repeat protein
MIGMCHTVKGFFAHYLLLIGWFAAFQHSSADSGPTATVSNESDAEIRDDNPRKHFRLRGEADETAEDYEGYRRFSNPAQRPEVVLLSHGNRAYLAGDWNAAIEVWQKIITAYPNTPAWNMAVLNTGGALQEHNRHAEAISTLTRLLDDTANYLKVDNSNWLSTESADSTPMDAYLHLWNNDWYDACKAISESFEALNDLESAQKYAISARRQFPHRAMCGTAGAYEWSRTDERIANLAKSLHARIEIAFEVLAVAIAAFFMWLGIHLYNRRDLRLTIRWAIVVVTALIAYPLSFGPTCWLAQVMPSCSRLVSSLYFPILRSANRSPQVSTVALWYAALGARGNLTPAFDGDELSWWQTDEVAAEPEAADVGSSM